MLGSLALLFLALAFGGMGPCGPSNGFGVFGLFGGLFGLAGGFIMLVTGGLAKAAQSFTHHEQE